MADLTPIPAKHRRVYYDALLAGRAEADRLGYPLLDDRIFAAFHRALYGPMVELIVADTRLQIAKELWPILIAHQRHGGGCLCGWAELGRCHAKHIVAAWEATTRGSGNDHTAS